MRIQAIDIYSDPVVDLVSTCFPGWKPRNSESDSSWVGHIVDGRVISAGAVYFYEGGDFAGLHTAGVHPEFRRRGLHRELIKHRLDLARERGCKWALVDCMNPAIRRGLQDFGFSDNERTGSSPPRGWRMEVEL